MQNIRGLLVVLSALLCFTQSAYGQIEFTGAMEVPNFEFVFEPESPGLKATNYRPNARVNMGAGLRYRGYGAMLMLPLPSEEGEVRKKGQTNHFDLVLSKSFDWGGFDFFFATYSGFYKEKSDAPGKSNKDEVFPQRSDVNTRNIGINSIYLLSPVKYSLHSESNDKTKGFKQSGSILLVASANNFRVWGDRSLLEASDGFLPDDHNQLRAGEFTSVAAGGGYGHEFNFDANRLKMQMLLGFGPQWQRLESEAATTQRTMTATKVTMSMNYEYVFNKWRMGMDLKHDQVAASLGSVKLESQHTSVSLFARTDI